MNTSKPASPDTETTQPTSTTPHVIDFPEFGTLPVELRLKIWKFAACDNPRTIIFSTKYPESSDGFSMKHVPSGDLAMPAVLQVNHEARDVALTFYKQPFTKLFSGRPVYFNFDVDALKIVSWEATLLFYKWSSDISNMEKGRRNISQKERLKWLSIDSEGTISPWYRKSSISSKAKQRRRAVVIC